MTLFDHLDLVTVVGQALTLDQVPAVGRVTFTSSSRLVDRVTGQAVFPVALSVAFDQDGNFTIDLPATDDPNLSPYGWTYAVSVSVAGSKSLTFSMLVPLGSGPINLFLATPVATSDGIYIPGPATTGGSAPTTIDGGTV